MTIEQILTEAMQLPVPSRAFIVEKLLESLDDEGKVELSDEWLTEIRQRMAAIEAGDAQRILAEKVIASIHQEMPVKERPPYLAYEGPVLVYTGEILDKDTDFVQAVREERLQTLMEQDETSL